MIPFAAAVLLLQLSAVQQSVPTSASQAKAAPYAASATVSERSSNASALPDAPVPANSDGSTSKASSPSPVSPAQPGSDNSLAGIYVPARSASSSAFRNSTQWLGEGSREKWLALAVLDHGAAVFDAWSTRRSIEIGNREADPFVRPFAGSNAVYGVLQITPTVLDFVSRRMQRSEHPVIRRFWWLPQSAMAASSFCAGVHNVALTR